MLYNILSSFLLLFCEIFGREDAEFGVKKNCTFVLKKFHAKPRVVLTLFYLLFFLFYRPEIYKMSAARRFLGL